MVTAGSQGPPAGLAHLAEPPGSGVPAPHATLQVHHPAHPTWTQTRRRGHTVPQGVPNWHHSESKRRGRHAGGRETQGLGHFRCMSPLPTNSPLTVPQISWLPPATHLVKPGGTPHSALLSGVVESGHVALGQPVRLQHLQGPEAPHKALPGVRAQPTSHHQPDLMSTFCLVLRQVGRAAGASASRCWPAPLLLDALHCDRLQVP